MKLIVKKALWRKDTARKPLGIASNKSFRKILKDMFEAIPKEFLAVSFLH